jgi:hypothetical protein
LLLLGVVTLVTALPMPAVLREWWPIALVIGGALLVILGLARRAPADVKDLPAPGFESLPPAPGADVITNLPAADPQPRRAAPKPAPPPPDENVDIYELIKQQPQDKPPSQG